MNLFQVQSPHFTAGFCVDAKNVVWEAAPILRWMKNKHLKFVEVYCKNKGWSLVSVN